MIQICIARRYRRGAVVAEAGGIGTSWSSTRTAPSRPTRGGCRLARTPKTGQCDRVPQIEPSSTIRLSRRHAYADSIRLYKVMLDGDHVCDVADDSAVEVSTTPGRHELYLRIAWCRSPILTFIAPSGGSVELECGSTTNFASAIYRATLGRDRYIDLRLIKADRDK